MDFIVYIYLGFRFWLAMYFHRNSLPKEAMSLNPKMEMEGMSWAVYWEDEGIANPSYYLTSAFIYVIHYRTSLIVGDVGKIANYGSKNFNKLMYKLAKFYFPDWIGFEEKRNAYHPELANKILRMQKVAEWKFKKMLT